MKGQIRTACPGRPTLRITALVWFLLVALCSASALAQPTTVQLDIRKAEVIDQKYFVYFSFLDGSRKAIEDISISDLSLLSTDRQKQIPIGQAEVAPLVETEHAVSVMFVVANYKAFNEGNASTLSAIREFLSQMEPRTDKVADLAGVVYYSNSFRDVSFTYKIGELKEQILKIQESKDTIPRLFAALGNAIRRFDKEVSTQKVDQRYIVLITDGHGVWEGASNPQAVDNRIKQIATSLKEKNINLVVVGYSPTLNDQDPSLTMLQQLANQSGGTYRGATEQDQVFELVKDSYNEIYKSHVLTFRSNTLKPGQNHKIRLNVDYKNLKAKSPPHTVYVPASEGLPSSYFIYGGVGCLVLGLLGVIGMLIFVIWRRRKEQKEREASEFDEFVAAQEGGVGAGAIPTVAPPSEGLPPILQGRPEYSDEPPGDYKCSLRAVGGPAHGRTFYVVQESTTIGSAEESDIMILDSTVSKKHAGIRIQEGNRFELHDFGSTNGVFINGKRISKQFLKNDDRIRIGETELVFSTS